jgi:Raf kinase inhibitor-like YbhB/YbcL family protein
MAIDKPRVVRLGVSATAALWLALASCGQTTQPASQPQPGRKSGGSAMKVTVQSSAFKDGQPIDRKYTEDGADVSPALSWSGVPAETRELALICDDPDAPRAQPWVHWVLYKLPANLTGLPEGMPKQARLSEPVAALQGKNDWGTIGYRGPAPPKGKVHHYHFKLYALKNSLDLPPELTKDELLKQIQGQILAEGELIGTYKR